VVGLFRAFSGKLTCLKCENSLVKTRKFTVVKIGNLPGKYPIEEGLSTAVEKIGG
jgi:hypothetical protein